MLQSGATPLVYAGMNVILEEIVTIMKLVSNDRYRILITLCKFGVADFL